MAVSFKVETDTTKIINQPSFLATHTKQRGTEKLIVQGFYFCPFF